MTDADPEPVRDAAQSRRFLWLYALAVAGGAVAYVPFLTILLPVRVSDMAKNGNGVAIIAYLAFFGAIAASLANIAFGWASDRLGSRKPLIWLGLILSCLLLTAFAHVETFETFLALLVFWQAALNMMLAPLVAWAGDTVPDHQKGTLGGLLAFAPALGAFSGALVTIPGLAGTDARLIVVAAMVAVMVLPVLLFGKPTQMPRLEVDSIPTEVPMRRVLQGTVARMWLARLLVQVSEAALFAFLLLWFRDVDPALGDNRTARIFSIVLAISVPLALLAGRWSDVVRRPLAPLTTGAFVASVGLVCMAMAQSIAIAIVGYVVFGLATSVFLALHTSQTLRVLPRPATRGRDLGIFNLTNTVPSLIMPWLTLAMVPVFGFAGLFLVLAVLAAMAGVLLWRVAHP